MNENIGKTPEEIEKELSVGNFAKQQATTLGLTFGGAGLGYLAGSGIAKTKLADWIGEKSARIFNSKALLETASKEEIAAAGKKLGKPAAQWGMGFIGLMIGSIASQYGHWKKVERERKGVEEINKDVAHIMENRTKFEETLDTQAEYIKRLVAERKPQAEQDVSFVSREEARNHGDVKAGLGA